MTSTVSPLQIEIPRVRGWQRLIQRLAATAPASWLMSHWLPSVDRFILRQTRGQYTVASLLTGLPVITLTTFGVKTGQPRQCPLVPILDGEKVILIASNFGNTRHPSWYINLRANPKTILAFNGNQATYTAREATEPERKNYWVQAVKLYPGYRAYENRAKGRKIPILVLTPEEN